MRWKGIGKTDMGCLRETNEDSMYVDNRFGLYIVADGIGGHAGGEVASRLVVDALPPLIKSSYRLSNQLQGKRFQDLLNENINAVDHFIFEEGEAQGLKGMGSTLVLLLIKKDKALVAHVGDSRCYLFDGEKLELLTDDHVCITEENVLLKAMGNDQSDQAEISLVDLKKNFTFLICSDGLNHMLKDSQIEALLRIGSPARSPKTLIQHANKAGGEDNITVISIYPKK